MLKVFIIVVVLFGVGYAVIRSTAPEVEFGNAGWEDERRRAVRSEAEFGVPGAAIQGDIASGASRPLWRARKKPSASLNCGVASTDAASRRTAQQRGAALDDVTVHLLPPMP